MKQFFYLCIFCVLALTACTDSFKKGDNGLEYKIVSSGSGKTVGYGNYLQLHFKQIYKGTKDTVLGDSRDFMPRINILDSVSTPPEYFKIIKQLRKGDSLVLRNRVDSFYKRAPGEIPKFMKKSDYIYTTLKIVNIFETKNEADSANKAESAIGRPKMFNKQMMDLEKEFIEKNKEQLAADDKKIAAYLAKNNITATKTKWGTYIATHTEGTGEKITYADIAMVNYTGKTLDSGMVIDSNVGPTVKDAAPYPVSISQFQVVIGWIDALLQMKKGSKATIYIPSTLAYGKEGRAPKVKPNDILFFEMEVVNVENEEAMLAKQEEAQQKMLEAQRRISDSLQKMKPLKK